MASLDGFEAVVFDTDGVLTDTAVVHAGAWQRLFDEFFTRWTAANDDEQAPFDPVGEYLALVDGKPRSDGVRSVLAARGIDLPEGDPRDGPGAETVCGLGNAKDAYFHERLRADGVRAFEEAYPRVAAALGIAVFLLFGALSKAVVGHWHESTRKAR